MSFSFPAVSQLTSITVNDVCCVKHTMENDTAIFTCKFVLDRSLLMSVILAYDDPDVPSYHTQMSSSLRIPSSMFGVASVHLKNARVSISITCKTFQHKALPALDFLGHPWPILPGECVITHITVRHL